MSIKKDGIVCGVFVVIALIATLYSLTLPPIVPDDEYTVLLGQRAGEDASYPDSELLAEYNYTTYLYPHIIGGLDSVVPMEKYRPILLFLFVFLVLLGAYAGLRLVRIPRAPAAVIAIIALIPRVSVGGTYFGVFTSLEVMGRTLALPAIWVLAGWHIRRLGDRRLTWPVLFAVGVAALLHPVSVLFFGMLLVITEFVVRIVRRNGWRDVCTVFYGVLAFVVGASPVLAEVVIRSGRIAEKILVTSAEYRDAVLFRIPWEFSPESVLWLRPVALVSIIFVIFVIYSLWKERGKETLSRTVLVWGVTFCCSAVVLSFILPALQLFLITHTDFPLLLQQTSRFFKFWYLGLFVLVGLCLGYLWEAGRIKKWGLGLMLVVGVLSSSLGLEWVQYVVGYPHYERAYIPEVFQEETYVHDREEYEPLCDALHTLGATRTTRVLSGSFKLRYFCEVPLYVTFEEGGAYLNRGREALVAWKNMFDEQHTVFASSNPEAFLSFAEEVGARYAVIRTDDSFLSSLVARGAEMITVNDRAIILLP